MKKKFIIIISIIAVILIGIVVFEQIGVDNDKKIVEVGIDPGDTKEEILDKVEDSISKVSNGFVTIRFIKPNQVFISGTDIVGEVLSENWQTELQSKDHSAGFVEIIDANGQLIVKKGLQEGGGPAVSGRFPVPFAFSAINIQFTKPSTSQGKIVIYDVNRNRDGLTKPLEIPIRF